MGATQDAFIATCVEAARESWRTYRVPVAVTIAQAILESGWGRSDLAVVARNYFGIKCSSVASPYQTGCVDKATWEHLGGTDVTVTAAFRTYATMRDSFLDHGLFLTRPRYAAAFETADPDVFAYRIWEAGYATDPAYPGKLSALMDQYNLRQYGDLGGAQTMAYAFHTNRDSPNHGGFGARISLPAGRCVLHWWGDPSGQDPWGIVDWLCSPASQVSAHAVIWENNVACIVDYDEPSWANGNTEANKTAVTIECDPNDIPGTIPTVVEYLADLVRQQVLAPDFVLSGHRDWYATACPGGYYPRLAEIRQAVRAALDGAPTETQPEEEEDDMSSAETISLLKDIREQLRPGIAGRQYEGPLFGQLRAVKETVARIEAKVGAAGPSETDKEQDAAVEEIRAQVEQIVSALAAVSAKLDALQQ